jgi:hypothetical protein
VLEGCFAAQTANSHLKEPVLPHCLHVQRMYNAPGAHRTAWIHRADIQRTVPRLPS